MAGIIIGMSIFSAAIAQPVYKWVDEDGNFNYSDQPPPQQYESEKFALKSTQSVDDARQSREKLIRIQNKLKRSQDRQTAAKEQRRVQKEVAQEQRADRIHRCLDAREQLQSLNLQMPVYYIDERGNWVFLNAEERAEHVDFYLAEINSFCG